MNAIAHILMPILWGLDLLLAAGAAAIVALRPLHLLQLESYQIDGYDRARKRQKGLWREGWILFAIVAGLFLIGIIAIAVSVLSAFSSVWGPPGFGADVVAESHSIGIIGGADGPTAIFVASNPYPSPWFSGFGAMLAAVALVLVRRRQPKAKTPLAFTKRMWRLVLAVFALNLLLIVLLGFAPFLGPFALLLPLPFQVWMVKLAAYVMQPVEKRINMGFFRDAQRRLRERPDLIKIGITGSYGKTSTKFILAAILAERFNVLATPSSFNTPMGLTRVIREQLRPEHQVFLAEMGARHVGDIQELCELVHPTIGAITSIGPQHLETFHSVENVANTKYELIDALPADGAAFFGDDGGECLALYRRDFAGQKTLAGVGPGEGVRAEDVEVGLDGSRFTLALPDGSRTPMHTQLLGAHNIQNIALCCAMAHHLGMSAAEIAAGVEKAPPVEHRLQLIQGAGGNVVIDDAFNSNPAGAKAAMEVLKHFPGRRIVVTPGMVELGEQEEELNREFGRQMAEACDVALLIGPKRAQPILQGLLEEGFAQENILVVSSLDEAAAWIGQNARPGDVTLFENDLPDNYSE